MLRFIKKNRLIIIIILIGLFIRLINITNNPPALYGDELTMVLDSYALLHTGKDQLGNIFPLTFEMGAGRPAGYVYLSIPFVAAFGPTAIGVRMLSILSGLGIILLIYLLGKKLFSKKLGLIAAFFTAFSFWDIGLSRGGFEAHFALFLALSATYFFLLGKEKPYVYIFSALFFGLTLHTYPTYKLILPIFLVILYWFQHGMGNPFKLKESNYLFVGFGVLAIFGFLALTQTLYGGSENRFTDINIFSQKQLREEIVQKINFERSVTNLSPEISKYVFNKPMEYLKVYGENYLQNFSPSFLFMHGDGNPRHNMASLGELYLVDLLLIFLGLVTLNKKRIFIFLILWIVISPLACAFVSGPSALRSAFMLPPLILIISLGFNRLLATGFLPKVGVIFVSLIFLIQSVYFMQKIYFLSPNEYSRFWSYPAKLASDTALENKGNFDYIFISTKLDNIEFAYPVYAKVKPVDIISQNKERISVSGYKFKKFENVYIGDIPQSQVESFIFSINGSVLYIGGPEMVDYLKSYETLPNKDGLGGVVMSKKFN